MDTIKKETVVEIIKWAEYQGHIKGKDDGIDVLIQNIMNYEKEK